MSIENLVKNVHLDLKFPHENIQKYAIVQGDYQYFHYVCDGVDDRGWGCGYRTLQTIASWMNL